MKTKTISMHSILTGQLPMVSNGGYKGATIRFDNNAPCCTSTYNYSMTDEEKAMLARRIAASINATRGIELCQLETMVLLNQDLEEIMYLYKPKFASEYMTCDKKEYDQVKNRVHEFDTKVVRVMNQKAK